MAQCCSEQRLPRVLKRSLLVVGMSIALIACGTPPEREVVPDGADGARLLPREGHTLGQIQEKARLDLAGRLSMPVELIEVEAARAVRWADESLGCPEPGRVYQPGRRDGWVITLAHRERRIVYHADRYRAIPCPPIEAE